MKRTASYLLYLVTISSSLLIGCNRDDALMIGGNYGEVLVGSNPLLHNGGNLRLYRYHSFGRRELVWPYVGTENPAVMGDLVIFNGGASDSRTWKFYPATFAYAGTGSVVEITKPLIRHVGTPLSGFTNYAFQLISSTNDVVQLDALQSEPIERSKPISLSTEVEKKVIMAMITAAHSNGIRSKYDGVEFIIAK